MAPGRRGSGNEILIFYLLTGPPFRETATTALSPSVDVLNKTIKLYSQILDWDENKNTLAYSAQTSTKKKLCCIGNLEPTLSYFHFLSNKLECLLQPSVNSLVQKFIVRARLEIVATNSPAYCPKI